MVQKPVEQGQVSLVVMTFLIKIVADCNHVIQTSSAATTADDARNK